MNLLAATTSVDLTPLINAGIEVLAPVLVAVVVWGVRRVTNIQLDDRAKALLETAMGNGLAYAKGRILPAGGAVTVDVKNEIVKLAADYVVAHVPDAAKRLGIDLSDPAHLEQKLEARLAQLI